VIADTVVETLAKGLRDEGRRVRVVTSDSETRHTVTGPLLQVTSVRAFISELEDAAGDAPGNASRASRRATVEDTLTPSVRAILLMMRDGRG
jgi:predicted RNA-binding protein with PIN domain